MIYSHGNATDIGELLPYLKFLQRSLKINIFGYDYQGYGLSKPKDRQCTEKRVYASVQSVLEYIMNVLNFPPEKIIL
jgi:abhydrolase domain-containing protein 17